KRREHPAADDSGEHDAGRRRDRGGVRRRSRRGAVFEKRSLQRGPGRLEDDCGRGGGAGDGGGGSLPGGGAKGRGGRSARGSALGVVYFKLSRADVLEVRGLRLIATFVLRPKDLLNGLIPWHARLLKLKHLARRGFDILFVASWFFHWSISLCFSEA